ncbi:MAG: Fic family protein [Idiomarina sp.]
MATTKNQSREWLWQHPQWPDFQWQTEQLQPLLRRAYDHLGQLKGRMASVDGHEEFTLDALLANIVASSAIESEKVDVYAVRSSLARQLGINDQNPIKPSEQSEHLASLMRDAVTSWQDPLTVDTLLQWHRWLFQSQTSLLQKVVPGELRGESPMQIVSGPMLKPKVHFEAPPRSIVESELNRFVRWFNETADSGLDPLVRAGITHLWFVTIHPFEDGNGRITRALTDRALAQSDQNSIRLFAMSEAILQHRNAYYDILERTQKHGIDITHWLAWFIETLTQSVEAALARIERTLFKTKFWTRHADKALSEPQRKVLNRLLDGDFEQGINATQYQRVAKVSKATATRHLTHLVERSVLEKLPGGGRSTRYRVTP